MKGALRCWDINKQGRRADSKRGSDGEVSGKESVKMIR